VRLRWVAPSVSIPAHVRGQRCTLRAAATVVHPAALPAAPQRCAALVSEPLRREPVSADVGGQRPLYPMNQPTSRGSPDHPSTQHPRSERRAGFGRLHRAELPRLGKTVPCYSSYRPFQAPRTQPKQQRHSWRPLRSTISPLLRPASWATDRSLYQGIGGDTSIVPQAFDASEARRGPRRVISVGRVAVGARHPRRPAVARVLAVPGEIVMRLADPIGVAAAGALHCTPQDRRISHRGAR
jgi:hypothetical protein